MKALITAVTAIAAVRTPRVEASAQRPLGGRERADSEQHGVQAREVVRLAVADQVHEREPQVRQRQKPKRTKPRAPERRAETGEPDRHEHRAHHHQLERDEACAAALCRARDVSGNRDLRPAVLLLPHEIRAGQQQRREHAACGPPAPQRPARPDRRERNHADDRDDAHLRLRFEADADDDTGGQKRDATPSHDRSDHEPQKRRRAQEVERRRTREVANRQRETRHRGAHRSDQLRSTRAADLARDKRREQRGRCADERRRQSQEQQRARREVVHEPTQERHERRLIGIPKSRM